MQTSNGMRRRGRQSARRRFDHGCRLAALRAITAARLHLKHGMKVKMAARACGSNTGYVTAAAILLRSENSTLIEKVLHGDVSILDAAHEVQRLGDLVAAYRQASASDHVAFAKAIGPTCLFDSSLVPAL
jgi:hypothetical protein